MLKKAGIVVAVAAAGVLAVAPLAFATDNGDSGQGNVSSTCTFDNTSDNGGSVQGASGEALLGAAAAAANANAPVTTQGNAPVASCNNLNDILNIDSKNQTETTDESDNSVNNSNNGTFSFIPLLP